MAVIYGSEQNFHTLIQKDLVLVDFFATWCGPCKMLGPVLEQISDNRSDVEIVKIDTDECPNLSKEYGIMSVPTLLLFKEGKLVATEHGFVPKPVLEDWINKNR